MLRQQQTLERGWPWLALAMLTTVVLVALMLLLAGGVIDDPWGNDLRGYTLSGILLGCLAVSMTLATYLYSARKRAFQERMPGRGGSMMLWLWVHVTLGCLALLAALLHAGLGALSFPFSSGKLLLYVFAGLTVSGIVWRLVYRFVPPRAAPKVGNYSQEGAVARAEALTTEIEKLCAGKPAPFLQLRDWLLAAPRAEAELAQAAAAHDPALAAQLRQLHQLIDSRRRALSRHAFQGRYTRVLQRWRKLHVPLAFLLIPLLIAHVIGALRVPERLAPIGSMPLQTFSGFAPSSECKTCHLTIYKQWKRSMHAHALSSPVMIAQGNQVLREELFDAESPDPKLVCVNCHGPMQVALTKQQQGILPFSRPMYSDELLNEGIGCTTCHQLTIEDPTEGVAGLSSFQEKLRLPGDTYYAQIEDPVPNAYHRSAKGPIFDDSAKLCVSCHNVVYDLDGNNRIDLGVDLILQQTTVEYEKYRKDGGPVHCLQCHMPVDPDQSRAADGAWLLFEQDVAAPERVVHDHSFVGVDYPIDQKKDYQGKKRRKLLRSAVTLDARAAGGKLTVTIENSGAGHNVPTGLAFARQMWLEVKMLDGAGRLLKGSGVLDEPTDDLCDNDTMAVPPAALAKHVRGCKGGPDAELVNFQQKLIERIDVVRDAAGAPLLKNGQRQVIASEGARESVLQRIKGGAVPRVRPIDQQKLTPIPPRESRSFDYAMPNGVKTVTVRLLFRIFPPYFLRGLAKGQEKGEKPRIKPLIKNLRVERMAKKTIEVP
jgi:hypothetical protein